MHVLTHSPSPHLDSGQRTFLDHVPVDLPLAMRQHVAYCDKLRELGAAVHTSQLNAESPDSVFIEDVAVVLDEVAILASMASDARVAEPSGMLQLLEAHRPVARIDRPATIEGGDVLRVGRTLLVGQSDRTNYEGFAALATIVEPFGYSAIAIPVTGCLHLKTACTALPDGRLLTNPRWIDAGCLQQFQLVPIPGDEPWSANTLVFGETVIVPTAHRRCAVLIRSLGFTVESVDTSEFAKVEGGVTCLSIVL